MTFEQAGTARAHRPWHDTFCELVASIGRACGLPPPAIDTADDGSACVELEIDGRQFDLWHASQDDERLSIHCHVASLGNAYQEPVLHQALRENLSAARMNGGMFAFDEDAAALVFCTADSLATLQPEPLLQQLAALGRLAEDWSRRHLGPA